MNDILNILYAQQSLEAINFQNRSEAGEAIEALCIECYKIREKYYDPLKK